MIKKLKILKYPLKMDTTNISKVDWYDMWALFFNRTDIGVKFTILRSMFSMIRLLARTKPTSANGIGNATSFLSRIDEGSWWVGRLQAMKRHIGHMFGVLSN